MTARLGHRLEAILVRGLLALLGRLPPATASNLGGAVARAIGPRLPVTRVADANLRLAMPGLDAAARTRIIRGVWDNLGRTAGEFPHVAALGPTGSGPGWELAGDGLAALLGREGPVVMVSGHLGNWEVAARAASAVLGRRAALLYRAASNPIVDRLIQDRRGADGAPFFAKGAGGARAALAHLRGGGVLAMLVDQKMNDGISVPFFGHPAMTAPAAAAMALRFDAPVVPAYVRRIGPARFRLVVEPALPLPATGDRHADVAALTRAINARLEAWITDCPEQWLWLHRRWPREATP